MTELKEVVAEAVELIRGAQDAARELGNEDLNAKLMEARERLGTVREALLEAREESAALEERVKTLERSFELKPTLVRNKGCYWVKADPDPWCPVCWERDQKALHLNRSDLMAGRLCSCPVCQFSANLDTTSPPKVWPDPDDL